MARSAESPAMMHAPPDCAKTIRHLLLECGGLRKRESALILCDPTTRDFASLFREEARKTAPRSTLLEIPIARTHGQEPPAEAARLMLETDLIVSLCRFSLAHTSARIEAGKRGGRFLSMPGYTWDLLADPALLVDYKGQTALARRVADLFTAGRRLEVRSRGGTEIRLDIEGRTGNCCPGFVEKPGELGSPPDIESNVSPLEDASEGRVVVDGSVTSDDLGLLAAPVALTVRRGRVVKIESADPEYVAILERMFEGPDSKRRVLAECGVGLNPKATLTGSMLTDEGALGCMHFGFGSNYTVGGKNKVDFHMDFVFRRATLLIDGRVVMKDGEMKL